MADVPVQQPVVKGSCEYHCEVVPKRTTTEDILLMFHTLGAQGWNLVLVTDIIIDDGNVRAWFKRELLPPAE